ncbi:DUF935 domain-containing protein [Leeia sp. TBRC 13508]|uniref:DUF935 domain-containing protein n=1 Tax=Leeia speluncae TaxID=2884804 RepID=A0ABS8D2A2_9NEIS|nr:DUF935 family protein [Leeia speluncae]MCB6182324.1 DUF935 domain-containing protein [Leeia speluncae]
MRPQDDTLATRGGGKGLKIYDEIERDCHAFSVLQKRKLALIARPIIVEAASPSRLDKKARDLVEAQLNSIGFDRLCQHLMDAVLKGYAAAEIIWELRGSEVWVSKFKAKDARRFAFGDNEEVRLLTRSNMWPGEEVPPGKFIVHRYGAKDGNPYGLGMGSRLFWPVFFKRQGIQFWLTFADKFGSPTALGKYPQGTPEDQQQELLDALERISHDAGVAIPEGMELTLLEAARSGSINTYESLCRYMDEEMSKAVLGETLSTSVQGGSYAAARTHNEVRLELVQADADLLTDTLTEQLVSWIVAFNVPGANLPRVYRDCSVPEDLQQRADRDEKLGKVGYRPTLASVQQVYGEGYEEIPKPAPAGKTQGLAAPVANDFAEHDATEFADQQLIDLLATPDPAELGKYMAEVMKPVFTAIKAGKDETELLGLLAEVYPKMNGDALEAELGRILFIANLVGRLSAQSEATDA